MFSGKLCVQIEFFLSNWKDSPKYKLNVCSCIRGFSFFPFRFLTIIVFVRSKFEAERSRGRGQKNKNGIRAGKNDDKISRHRHKNNWNNISSAHQKMFSVSFSCQPLKSSESYGFPDRFLSLVCFLFHVASCAQLRIN